MSQDTMKVYRVTYISTYYETYEIAARSPSIASEQACLEGEFKWDNCQSKEISEIEEI